MKYDEQDDRDMAIGNYQGFSKEHKKKNHHKAEG